jgi:hypothetical protein
MQTFPIHTLLHNPTQTQLFHYFPTTNIPLDPIPFAFLAFGLPVMVARPLTSLPDATPLTFGGETLTILFRRFRLPSEEAGLLPSSCTTTISLAGRLP